MKGLSVCLLAISVFIISCKKGFTTSDFEGKTYTAKIQLDTTNENDEVFQKLSGLTGMTYAFGPKGEATLSGEVGTFAVNRPAKWSVVNDSLVMESSQNGQTGRRAWGISKTNEGFLLNSGRYRIELIEKTSGNP
ncbi:hypothetical protein GCM10027592_63360 [Spirosoma flavus]